MIFVTGATGFIGRHLVQHLVDQGHAVRCLVRATSDRSGLPARGVELIEASLLDELALGRALRGCSVVYHLAAQTSALSRDDLYRTNVAGCRAIARACATVDSASPPTLVLVSSIAAAGTAIAGRSRTPSDPPHPVSEYGRSKRGGELAACQFAAQIPISVVRPGIVIGADSQELQPMFEAIARLRLHPVPGYTPRRVALIHVADLVEILVRVAQLGKRVSAEPIRPANAARVGDGYYFAATEAPTFAEFGRMISRALGTGMPLVLPIPEPLAWLAAALYQTANRWHGTSESFNLDKMREAFAGHWTSATESLQLDLGFAPEHTIQHRLQELRAVFAERASAGSSDPLR